MPPNFNTAQQQYTVANGVAVGARGAILQPLVLQPSLQSVLWVQGLPGGTFTLWIGSEFKTMPALTEPVLLRWELWVGASCSGCGNAGGCWWEDWPVAAVPMLIGPTGSSLERAGRVFELHAATADNVLIRAGVVSGTTQDNGIQIPYRFDWRPQETGPFPRVTIGAPVG